MSDGQHRRESTTPMDDGTFLVDCSCGAEYFVPQGGKRYGGDEYAELEAARQRHIQHAEWPR